MRLDPEYRKALILVAALRVAESPGGWSKLTREAVAAQASCADALVSKYFGTMTTFKRTIMRHAIKNRNLSIIAQGLAVGDVYAKKADDQLKKAALEILSK